MKQTITEAASTPVAQLVVGSGGIAAALTSWMGYVENGAALVALVGGAIIVVLTAMHGFQRIKQDKLDQAKLLLEIEALERAANTEDPHI